MENILVEQRNSFNFLLKKSQKKITNSDNYIDLSDIKKGWLIRNQIIWYKPYHMPSLVKNRFSNTYEVIYFFTKNDWEKKVYFDLDTIKIPHKSNFKKRNPKMIINENK